VYAIIVYVMLGGYKLHSDKVMSLDDIPAFNRNQIITLAGIAVMVFLVLVLKVNVGLTGFAVAMVLSFLRVADEGEAIKRIPWGTLLLITGVGVLMHIIIMLGGIKLLSEKLAQIMTPGTSVTIMGITSGIMSWFSSTSGVVMPTLIPTIPDILARLGVGGPDLELEMATAITMISNTAGISPLSTGGALALAAYTSAASASPYLQHRLFIRMFAISAFGVLVLSILAYFGLYRMLL
jgi:di/tricarboxylate transporter